MAALDWVVAHEIMPCFTDEMMPLSDRLSVEADAPLRDYDLIHAGQARVSVLQEAKRQVPVSARVGWPLNETNTG